VQPRGLEQVLEVDVEAPRLSLEQLPSEIDAPGLLLGVEEVLDLVSCARRRDEVEPVAARLVSRLRHDLHDVAVLEPLAEGHHPPVDAGPPRTGARRRCGWRRRSRWPSLPRQRLHLAPGGEGVHLLRIEIHLEVLQELLRVADLLLPLEQLSQPAEVLLIGLRGGAALLVLPVRGDAVLGNAVHVLGADLDLEGEPRSLTTEVCSDCSRSAAAWR